MISSFPKRIIICGSGNSITEGLNKNLSDIVEYEYSIGINYWYKYGCKTTFTTFVDYIWYMDNLGEIKDLPLVIGAKTAEFNANKVKQDNTFLLPFSNQFHGIDSWEKGFYKTALSGFFSLTLAIALGFKEIYLLGYDCCEIDGKTHFYQDDVDLKAKDYRDHEKFRGIGKYDNGDYKGAHFNSKNNINKWFDKYNITEPKVKIYNVSPLSMIDSFEKLSYDEFFERMKLDNTKLLQTRARENIKDILEEKRNG